MTKSHGHRVGIEAKIEAHPVLDVLGFKYESWRRTAINWLQQGFRESDIEKRLQKEFDLDWAWADSLATEASQCLSQLVTAKEQNIARIKEQIKKKVKRAKDSLKQLEKLLKSAIKFGFATPQDKTKFANKLLGLKSKTIKIEARHSWSAWNRVARYIKRHRIPRARLFQWMKALEGILTFSSEAAEHQPSSLVDIETGESKNPHFSQKIVGKPISFKDGRNDARRFR